MRASVTCIFAYIFTEERCLAAVPHSLTAGERAP